MNFARLYSILKQDVKYRNAVNKNSFCWKKWYFTKMLTWCLSAILQSYKYSNFQGWYRWHLWSNCNNIYTILRQFLKCQLFRYAPPYNRVRVCNGLKSTFDYLRYFNKKWFSKIFPVSSIFYHQDSLIP